MNSLQIIMYVFAGLVGLCVGSFLNVCVYRIPQGLSLNGRSFCPHCKTQIPFYRNVPVITWLLQRGRAACCQKPIAIMYPTIELFTGILSLAVMHKALILPLEQYAFDPVIGFFLFYIGWFALFVSPLIVISMIDFQLKIIPDVISLPSILTGTIFTVILRWPHISDALIFSGLGIFIGGGVLWALAEIVSRLKGQDAMGGGDIKLIAMLGAFIGIKGVVFVFLASSILALLYFGLLAITKRQDEDQTIPFGPFLSMGGLIYFLYGKLLTDFYFIELMGHSINPLI